MSFEESERDMKRLAKSLRCAAILVVFSAAGLASAAPPTAANSDSSVGGGNILFVAEVDREQGSTAGVYEVREIGADGRGEKLIRAFPSSFASGAVWSPNGTAIALEGQGGVVVMRISDGRTTLVAPNADLGSFAWSPDGRRVAYIARGKGLQIFTANVAARRP